MLTAFIIFLPQWLAAQEVQTQPGKKQPAEESDIWQQISEIKQEKDFVYKKYKKDKEDLERKFQEEQEVVAETGGDDTLNKQILLEKEFNRKKERLLKVYRRDNWALEKKANALKGRKTVVTSEMQIRRRLQNSPVPGSTQGVKK